jgi:hypothetical protein
MLLEMGFPLRKVENALAMTRNGTVDECVLYLEQIQGPLRPPPEAVNVRDALLSMGYHASVVDAAIVRVGGESLEQCIDEIKRMAQAPDGETAQDRLVRARQTLAAKRATADAEASKRDADAELKRRQEVREQIELRERIARAKEENEAKLRQSQKLKEQSPVLQTDASKVPPKTETPPSPKAHSVDAGAPCTLQLVIDEDRTTFVGKFKAGDTLRAVCDFVIEKVPAAAQKRIAFETVVPRQLFESSRFGESLSDLNLTPRARVIVKYL